MGFAAGALANAPKCATPTVFSWSPAYTGRPGLSRIDSEQPLSSADTNAETLEQPHAWFRFGPPALLIALITITSASISYLLYHFLVEFFTIAVAFLLGVVSWYTHPLARNGMIAFLGIMFPAVAFIDLAHTLVYEGMHVLPVQGANAPSQLWLEARLLQAVALLAAPAFIGRALPRGAIATGAALVVALSIALVAWDLMPVAYLDGVGLTPFKIVSEWVIILLFSAALANLHRRRRLFDPTMLRLLQGGLLCFIVAEFAFTQYIGTYDLANLFGHLAKLAGFWLIFLAVVKTGLEQPIRLLSDKVSSYDAIPQPVIVVDRSGHIRQVNSAARRAAPALTIGSDQHTHFHPSTLTRDRCPICTAVAEGRRVDDMELHYPDAGRWRLLSVAPLSFGPMTQAMVQVIYDITNRKEAELARRAAENRTRLLLESVGEGICGVDREGRISFVNAAAARMLGYAPDAIIRQPLHALVHHQDTSNEVTAECPMHRALTDGRPHRSEKEFFLRSDGTTLPVAYVAMPLVEEGRIIGAVVSFLDISERLAAAAALHDSEERFRSISAAAQDAIVMIDDTGRIAYWNPSAERMLGYRSAEALGRDVHDLIAPAQYRAHAVSGLTAFAATGGGPAIEKVQELSAMRKDGGEFPVELSVSALLLDGRWHAVGILRDVSERKSSEALQRQLLAIIEATPDFVATFTPTGEITYLNGGARALVGHSTADAPALDIEQVYPPRAARILRDEALPHAMRTGLWQGELVFKSQNTREIPVSQIILAHEDEHGTVTHLSAVARDISDRKQLEAALRAAAAREEHFANAVINSLPGFYFLVDQAGHLYRWNTALEQVTGYTSEQMTRMHLLSLFHRADRDALRSATERVFEDGRAEIQVALLTHSGRTIPCFMTGIRFDAEGKRYLTGTALDISALKEAEAALASSEARLRHALQCAHAGTWDLDLLTGNVHWSDEMYRLYGMEPESRPISPDTWMALIAPEDRERRRKTIALALSTSRTDYSIDYRIIHPTRGERWLGEFGRIQYGVDGNAANISGLDLDITARKTTERLLQQLAKHDHLTGLYNRQFAGECFARQMKRAARYARPWSIVLFDIDHFKAVNDTYGHTLGDEVLKGIARTGNAHLREADVFVRWGGEEFLVIAPETDLEGAHRIAEKLRAAIAQLRIPGVQPVTASFGVAQYRSGETTEKLVTRADDALYAAKSNGRNRVESEGAR
jgi:diguanylate cyclase (GGDEF)-like protein/PAS domain S-box-containing protein